MLDAPALRAALAQAPTRQIPLAALRPAAVLLPLFCRDGSDALLFTRRTESLRHHRGEISFPGGAAEAQDADLFATALRETEEEIGVAPASVEILGRLDDFVSVHDYHVTPYVGIIPPPVDLQVDAGEIAALIELPLVALSDPAAWRSENWQHRGRAETVWFCAAGGQLVWGLTAAILRQFLRRTGMLA
jgi:8-oxo-dGTP pyrophosphatase MutT (NUDIX family)